MKLTQAQLEAHSEKKLLPVYLVSGDDIFLVQEAQQVLRKAAKRAGFTELVRINAQAGYDWEQLYSILYANSLLAEKRIIEINFTATTPHKIACQYLQEYAAKPNPDNMVIICLDKVDSKLAKAAWYQALDNIGAAVPLWPIAREQMPQWIMQRAQKYRLTCLPDAARLLADVVEGNLVAAAQTIEKVYLLQPEKAIDNQLINTILANESQYTVFDLTDSLLAKDKTRSLHILNNLAENHIEPVLILWSITREVRTLNIMKQQAQRGLGAEEIMQKHRVFPRRQPLVRKYLQHFTLAHGENLLQTAFEIDKVIKGINVGNVWQSLQLLCLKFADIKQ